jgi:hypothetical protein
MIDDEAGASDRDDSPEPIRDDRSGGDPAAQGDAPSSGDGGDASGSEDQAAIDLETVRDRAS